MTKNLFFLIASCLLVAESSAQYVRTHSLCYDGNEVYTDSVAYYYTDLILDSLVSYHTDDGITFNVMNKEWKVYDENGFLSEHTFAYFIDGVIVDMWRYTFINDNLGNILQQTMQNYVVGEWINNSLAINTYDGNGILLTSLTQYWEGSMWLDASLTEYANDSEGHISSVSSYYYEGVWYEQGTTQYTYTDGLLTLVEYFDTNLEPYLKEEYFYDGSVLVAYVQSTWAFNAWFNNDTFYEYDINGNMVHEYWGHLEYTGGDSEYINDGGCYHFYEWAVVNTDAVQQPVSVQVYPNPSSDYVHISMTYPSSTTTLAATGMDGKRTAIPVDGFLADVSSLAAGVYVLEIETAQGLQTARLVRQ